MGHPDVKLVREMHVIKCALGHTFSGADLLALDPDMIKAVDMQPEQPVLTDIKWPIWIHPQIKSKLETKYHGRLWVTIATCLAALADDQMVMITGDQGKELRKLGLKSGPEIVAMAQGFKSMEKELQEANLQIQKFMTLLKQATAE